MIDPEAVLYARSVLEAVVRGHPLPETPSSAHLQELAAAFVTLRNHGELRGCLGDTSFERPFHEVIRRMTEAAATADPRFPSIGVDELPVITVEVSRLTRPIPAREQDICVGTHGIIVELDGRRGLLLPQVGLEFECDAPGFVALGCRKAGLDADAAGDPELALWIFEAEVRGE